MVTIYVDFVNNRNVTNEAGYQRWREERKQELMEDSEIIDSWLDRNFTLLDLWNMRDVEKSAWEADFLEYVEEAVDDDDPWEVFEIGE